MSKVAITCPIHKCPACGAKIIVVNGIDTENALAGAVFDAYGGEFVPYESITTEPTQ